MPKLNIDGYVYIDKNTIIEKLTKMDMPKPHMYMCEATCGYHDGWNQSLDNAIKLINEL